MNGNTVGTERWRSSGHVRNTLSTPGSRDLALCYIKAYASVVVIIIIITTTDTTTIIATTTTTTIIATTIFVIVIIILPIVCPCHYFEKLERTWCIHVVHLTVGHQCSCFLCKGMLLDFGCQDADGGLTGAWGPCRDCGPCFSRVTVSFSR